MRRIATVLLAALALAAVPWELPCVPVVHAKKKKKGKAHPAQEAFEAAYKSEDASERADAVSKLADAPEELRFEIVSTMVVPKEKRADVLGRVVTVLRSVKDEKVQLQIVKAAKKGKADHRSLYIEALATMPGSTPAHTALLEMLKDKDPFVRGMAAYSLGQHRAMDALDPLMKLLEDPAWQVRAAALAALPKLSDKKAVKLRVPEIVTFMETYSGRMRDDAAHCLHRITGRKLGRNPKAWRAYLAGDEEGATKDQEAKKLGAYGQGKPHFYGMEVTSDRFVILLDISLSMNDPMEIDKDKLRRETSRRKAITGKKGESGEDDDPDRGYDIPWWRIKTRLDLARWQTINLIAGLREDQSFELLLFSTKVSPWMGRLVPATSATKQRAIQMLKDLKPEDKTNTWGALAAGFDMMDNAKKSYQAGPDEMYLVTDGEPSVGDIVDKDQIYEAALQLWKVTQIRINCIGIGVNLRFMRKLCKKTGGTAKFFTAKKKE